MKQRLILYLYSIFFLLAFAGCHSRQDQLPSQAFQTVYNRFDHFNYPESLRQSLDSVIGLHPDLSFADRYNYYSYMSGYYHVRKFDDVKALVYTDSLLLMVTTHKTEPDNNIDRKASAYLARGGILFSLKKYNSALNYLYQGKLAAEQGNNQEIKSDVYYTMGMVMFKKLNYSQAARYFIQSFEATDTKQPMGFSKFYRMQEVLCNTSESYLMAGTPDSALMYFDKVMAFINSNQSFYPKEKGLTDIAKAVAEGNAGQAYLLQDDTAKGEALLRSSIAVNSRAGYDNGNALYMQIALAQFYIDKGFENLQPAKTSEILTDIKRGLDTVHSEELQAKWNYLMSHYYDMAHDPATAMVYLKQGIEYDKKTEGENKVLSETNINSYFQALQNEYEMQLLKESGQIEQVYLIISVILSVLCGIIILLIWRHWRQSKKGVDTLTRLNKKVRRQKKKLEETLVTLNARNAEKDHILKVIAHDLRNPISAINALSKLVKEDPTLDEEQNECLDLISSASIESLELIDAIMQIEGSQPVAIDKKLRDMNEIVSNCINQFRAQAASKEQTIVSRPSGTPQMALVDADKMQRVMKNLISNALKFSHKGSPVIVSVAGKEKSILIRVRDSGIGIPPAVQDKVFEPFTEARRKGTEDEKTFGLGLSICKQFVEAHGGKIWFKSREQEGTTFYVKLKKEEVNNVISDYSESLVTANESV